MEKLSQVPLGSGAAAESNGLANVQLNGNSDGITPSKLSELLRKVISNKNQFDQELIDEIGEYCDKIKDINIKKKLVRIGNALQMNNDKRKATRDPSTGKVDPDSVKLAKRLLKLISKLTPEGKMEKGASVVYNHRYAQQVLKKKKKTRGNPFRVLMGKVGKLLDHGVEKKTIVRFLAKLKYWNNETIERAVDIVKEYNIKKHRDTKSNDEDAEDVKEEIVDELKTHKSAMNNNKVVISGYDYTTKPNFEKRSTPELIFRACYLMDLMEVNKNTKQGDFKDVADKKGAKEELREIKAALVSRGFDKEELSNLGLGQ